MLTINTNLSSLIAQSSMKQSTNKLNQAIERMTTGFKINHASDNAANYSISTNMTTKIGAYNVAEDNAAMGLDLISTAEGTLNQIQDKLQRLRALAEQTSNGTYGEQSLKAINVEANALVDEINRVYSTAQFNGVSYCDSAKGAGCDEKSLPVASMSGFINEVQKRDTNSMTKLADIAIDQVLTNGTYSISTENELVQLAIMTNNGLIGKDTEFVLANDIDLNSTVNWTPIGNRTNVFLAKFDGNGYLIKNLTIDNPTQRGSGLFGIVQNCTIKNLGIINADIIARNEVGTLIGNASGRTLVSNCFATGKATGHAATGGLIGQTLEGINVVVESCYTDVNVIGIYEDGYEYASQFGGLIGNAHCYVKNSFALGNVDAEAGIRAAGGLLGQADGVIQNCYAKGNVTTGHQAGGLIGQSVNYYFSDVIIENCKSTGIVTLLGGNNYQYSSAGGLCATASKTKFINCSSFSQLVTPLTDSYELFNLAGTTTVTGIIYEGSEIINCLYDGNANNALNVCSENITQSNVYDRNLVPENIKISMQVGINSDEFSQISIVTSFKLGGLYSLKNIGLSSVNYVSLIDSMLTQVSSKQTELGAVSNRLESVLEEITIQRDNLVSSRSTIRDADIAEVSSQYIQQQILQQASATLLATANQSPAIALQLI